MSTHLTPRPPGLLRVPDAQAASSSTLSFSSTSTSSSGTGSSTFDRFSRGGSSASSLSDYTPFPSPLDNGAKSIFGCEPVQLENSSSRFSDEQWNGDVTDEQLSVHLAAVQPDQGVSKLSDMDRWLRHDEYEYEEDDDDSMDLKLQVSAMEALALRLKRDPPTLASQRALAFMEKRKMPESTMAQAKVVQEEVIEDYADDFDLDFKSIISIPESPDFLSAFPSTPRILPVDHQTLNAGDSSMLDAISPLLLDDPKIPSLPAFHMQSMHGSSYPTSPLTVASVLFNQRHRNSTPVSSDDRTPTQSPRQRPTVGLGLDVDTNIQVDTTGRPIVSTATSALFAGSDFPVEGLSDYVTGTIDVEPSGVPSSSNDSMTQSNNSDSDLTDSISSISDLEPTGAQLAIEDDLSDTADVELDALVAIQVDEVNAFDVEPFEAPLGADDSFASFATSASCYSVASPEFNLQLIPDHPREYALDADSVFDGPSSDWVNFGYMNDSSEPLLDTIMQATEDHMCSGPSQQRTQAGEFTARLTERLMASLPSLPSLNSIANSSTYFADVDDAPDASCDDSYDSESALSTCLATEQDLTDDSLEYMNVSLPYDDDSSSLFTIHEEDESAQDEQVTQNTGSTIRRYVPRAPPSHFFNYSRKEGDEYPSYDTFCPTVTAGSNHIAAINAGIFASRRASSNSNTSAASLPTITLSSEPDRPLNNGKNPEGLGLGLPSSLVNHPSETRNTSSAHPSLPTSEACWDLAALASGPPVKRVVSSKRVSISSSRIALSPLSNRSPNSVKSPVPTTPTPSMFQPFTLPMTSMIDNALLTAATSSQPKQRGPHLSPKDIPTRSALPQPTMMSKSDSGSRESRSRLSWNAFTTVMSRLSWSSSSGGDSSGRASPGMIEHTDVPQNLGLFNRTRLSSKLPARTAASTPSWSRKFRMLF